MVERILLSGEEVQEVPRRKFLLLFFVSAVVSNYRRRFFFIRLCNACGLRWAKTNKSQGGDALDNMQQDA